MIEKQISVTPGDKLEYTVSADGFEPYTGVIENVDSNKQIAVNLLGGNVNKVVKVVNTNSYMTGYLTANGDFYLCGSNTYGAQGNGESGSGKVVNTFTKRAENVRDFFLNYNYISAYITNDNELYMCGRNDYGQQGANSSDSVIATFTKRAENVKEFYASNASCGYITNNNEFYMCGRNDYGQQSDGSTTNVKTFTKRADNVIKFRTEVLETFILRDVNNGQLEICGSAKNGQQGSGYTTNISKFVARATNVKDFETYDGNAIGYITNDGDFYLCGANSSGLQGNDTKDTNVKSFTIRNPSGVSVKKIAITGDNSGFLTEDGALYLCGKNSEGQCASGSTSAYTSSFTRRAENVKDFRLGYTTIYITNDDELYMSGRNDSGQQGTGTTTNTSKFAKRADNVKKLPENRSDTVMFLDKDNNLWASGSNTYGQLGIADTTKVLNFTKLATNVDVFWNGNVGCYAQNGVLYTSGYNQHGQLGLGIDTSTNINEFTKASTVKYNSATLTINPTPSNATVVINGLEGNSQDVRKGTIATYTVSADGYESVSEKTDLLYDDSVNIDITLTQNS